MKPHHLLWGLAWLIFIIGTTSDRTGAEYLVVAIPSVIFTVGGYVAFRFDRRKS